MKLKWFLFLFMLLIISKSNSQQVNKSNFIAGKNEFSLNGKPYIIRAGELHYPRIPRAYWDHRIKMCKAMGMNTICIYLFWNYHEEEQGVFDFKGQKDVAEFVRLIQKNGMYCILRPGPYVCAEWEMGGLPWWLLKKKDLQVRTLSDSLFMDRTNIYLKEVGKQLAPYQIQNGGPIIMVQVENEYGVWGNEKPYMEAIRDHVRSSGFDKVQLFRCDWSSNFNKYQLPGVAGTLNFGAGSNIENQFKKFKEVNPEAPLMCSEYWTGWFDKWGSSHETRSINTFIGSLKDMMDRKISFSLYMAHGGTSFGQWAGANTPGYAPTTTSYDYNAPIDEIGNPTDKFYAVRELLKNYLQEDETLGDIPANPEKTINIPGIRFTQSATLFNNLPKANTSENIESMEYFNQGWGSILYRTTITASSQKRKLLIPEVHDWAIVFINGKPIGKLDRRRNDKEVEVPPLSANSQLDILVEGMGRINYGKGVVDRKGITEKVLLINRETEINLKNWSVYNLPVDYAFQQNVKYIKNAANGPGWYKASFILNETGNTYLDMSKWGKGMVWVNGYNLGRFWRIGPQQTLYLPGCWLKKGANEIIVFDLDNPQELVIAGIDHPILDKIIPDKSLLHRKQGQSLNLSGVKPVIKGTLPNLPGWQNSTFDGIKTGRYFCFEALSSQNDNDPVTSIAELEITGVDDKPISSLNWKVLYADSEEVTKANNTADKLFDLQESIVWQTQITGVSPKHPHQVVIDMGKIENVKGFRILPRSDKNRVGIVKDYQFYLELNPFKF